MKSFKFQIVFCLSVLLLMPVYSVASGSGHRSHGHDALEKGSEGAIVYKENKQGVDAYLEFSDITDLTNSGTGLLVKCRVTAALKASKTKQALQPTRLVLRATIGHDQFGDAMIFTPSDDNKMQTELFVKNAGEQHYLLVAEIEGFGVREFHFHHTF